MAAVENLRNVINERLTAAAEEILGVFAQTVSVYEEEICRQRRLLDTVLRPEIKLHRTELPQQHVCEQEEVLTDQQLCIQESNSSLDQEDPEPPQIKEEQEELCTSQEGEQLVLKQETDALKSLPTYERRDHRVDWTLLLDPKQNQMSAEKDPSDNISPKKTRSERERESSGGPEQNGEHQLLFHISHVADNQDQTSGNHGNATKPKQKYKGSKSRDKPFKCNSCSKNFDLYTQLKVHMTTHRARKPFICTVCGKIFGFKCNLKRHMITHSGEKPYACNQCQRTFRRFEHLQIHIRSHTGERPYICVYCEKALSSSSALTKHVRLHTGEKP
ncbi:zinc finger protein with KRAB and SCAN domains 8-like [Cottoperca gobio]|uniref:Zinc finger protein with KRAB and SCAN domains 8-like n=1 Tax=Cottoperca gobio TaxID=56716 RepID=A0A6J2QHF0_COTGO|nr:zinc finger protein with KRAB and SCAN domains 8-like [Cottoperca gobio]